MIFQRTHLLLPLLLSSAFVNASPSDCSIIAEDQPRLICYDSFFRNGDSDQPSAQDSPPSIGESLELSLSLLQNTLAEEAALADELFSITPHHPNYILPVSYNFSPDFQDYAAFGEDFTKNEIKMQLSLKFRLAKGMWRDSSLWAGYTQQSYWQLYAEDDASAPFRETNHEPELMWQIPTDFNVLGWKARVATLALNHQSNGRSEPLSRSWNRVTGELAMDRGRWVASAKTWIRIEEETEDDDNPNIEDYMGRLQLSLVHKRDNNTFAISLKNNLRSENRSGLEINWTFPLTPLTDRLKGFVQIYSGYGENLIDMENYNNRIGVGIALTDFL